MDFIKDEINFLIYVLNKYPAANNDPEKIASKAYFLQILNQQSIRLPDMITEVKAYLKLLEPYINNSGKQMDITMLEEFYNTALSGIHAPVIKNLLSRV